MSRRRLQIGLALGGGVFVILLAASVLVGNRIWEDRRALVARLADELGGVELVVEDVSFRLAGLGSGLLAMELNGLRVGGTRVEHASAGIDLLASLKARRPILRGIAIAGVLVGPAGFRAAGEPHVGTEGASAPPDIEDVWRIVLRFGSLRLENVEVATEAFGVRGPLHLERAELVDAGAGKARLTARATLADSGPLAVATEISIADGAVRLAELSVEAEHLEIAPFYFQFVDASDPLPPEPLAIDRLAVRGELVLGAALVMVDLKSVVLKSEIASATAAVYVKDAGPSFDYRVDVAIEQGTERVLPALPPSLLGKTVATWLAENLKTASVRGGALHLHGNAAGLSALDLSLDVKDSRLTFAPDWPEVEGIEAKVQVTETGLAVDGWSARIGAMPIERFTVVVPSFERAPVLSIDARLRGDTAATLATLGATPLAGVIRTIRALPLRLAGPLAADLRVAVKLDAEASGTDLIKVSGAAELLGVEAALTERTLPPLTDVTGKVEFSTKHIRSVGKLVGRFDGAPAAIAFALPLDPKRPVCKLEVEARPQLRSVLAFLGLGEARVATGPAAMHVSGEISSGLRGGVAYSGDASVDLEGAELELTGLLRKAPGVAARLEARFASEGAERHALDARYVSATDVVRTQLAIAPEKTSGKVDLALARARGQIILPKDASPVVASFTKIDVAARDGAAAPSSWPKAEDLAAAPALVLDPRTFPAVRFSCEDLTLGKRRLGRVALNSTKIPSGQAIDLVAIDLGAASLYDASGHWLMTPFGTDATLAGKVYLRDGGAALAALDLGDAVQGLHGDVDFSLSWPDLSAEPDPRRLTARFGLDVRDARIAAVDSVALKALDVLSLRFFDLTKEGLEIEAATAELTLSAGRLAIAKSRIESPTALLQAKGKLDFDSEEVAAEVAVTLKISRTINAVALGIVNPLLALGYLSQESDLTVVKLDGLTQHSYRVTGPWTDPEVELQSIPFATH